MSSFFAMTIFLERYFAKCVGEIDSEDSIDFGGLRWVGGDYVELVLAFLTRLQRNQWRIFFLDLLQRRWANQYHEFLPSRADVPPVVADWAQLERFTDHWLRDRLAREPLLPSCYREARQVIRSLKDASKSVGASFGRQRDAAFWNLAADHVRMRVWFTARPDGFSYWQDVQSLSDSAPRVRESYLSSFGFGLQTRFCHFNRYQPREVADFVVQHASGFWHFVQEAWPAKGSVPEC